MLLAILQFLHSQLHISITRIALTDFCEFLLSRRHKCVPAIAFRMLYGKYERSLTTAGAYKFLFLMKQYNTHTITFSIIIFYCSSFGDPSASLLPLISFTRSSYPLISSRGIPHTHFHSAIVCPILVVSFFLTSPM